MAGERYRIVIRVSSNFADPARKESLGEYAKGYLEQMLGIGTVEILSVEAEQEEFEHPADSETPTLPAPSQPSQTTTIIVKSEPETGIRKKIE